MKLFENYEAYEEDYDKWKASRISSYIGIADICKVVLNFIEGEQYIAVAKYDIASEISERFEDAFHRYLSKEYELGFDFIRIKPIDQQEMEQLMEDHFGDFDTIEEVLAIISRDGAILFMDEEEMEYVAADIEKELEAEGYEDEDEDEE